MHLLSYLSDFLIPMLIFYVVSCGIAKNLPVYDVFVKGASEGGKTVLKVLPTLVGLMVSVGMLRASGFLDLVAEILSMPASWIHVPEQLVPLALVRLFSSSAAISLVLDLYKEYGTDSLTGMTASIMMGCTETVFYTMSIYFMHVHVKKTRFTLAGSLFAVISGIAASIFLAGLLC